MKHKKFLSILTRCRDEFFIKEWVDYYLSQGVDSIYIIDDDSEDKSIYDFANDEKYKDVNIIYEKRAYANTNTTQQSQLHKNSLYNKIFRSQIKNKYEWLIYCDVDEFMVTKKQFDLTLRERLQTIPNDVTCICVPWVFMSGAKLIENPKSVLKEVVYRHDHDKKYPHSVQKFRCRYKFIEYKSILRTSSYEYLNDHTPVPTNSEYRVNGWNLNTTRLRNGGFKNLRNKHIENGEFLCYHYRYISEEQAKNKLNTNGWYINDGYDLEDLKLSSHPEIYDDTLLQKTLRCLDVNLENEKMKIQCDNIICIYSSCDHLTSALKLYNDLKFTNSVVIIFLTKDCKEQFNSSEHKIVYLDVEEGYTKLSLKTYEMLKYIHTNYDYKAIYKIDVTVETGETCQTKKEHKNEIFKKFFNDAYCRNKDYDGASQRISTTERFQTWANKKEITINIENFKEIVRCGSVKYYSGKFYVIEYDFAKYIIEKSDIKKLSSTLEKHLGGTEDLMIGLLYQNYLKENP